MIPAWLVEASDWLVRHPVLSHSVNAAIMMGLIGPALIALSVRGYAWHAAAYTSLYFYAREAAQAERALKPALGDPFAFYWTMWPGNWSAGGNIDEWLAPTAVAIMLAMTVPLDPKRRRAADRGGEP